VPKILFDKKLGLAKILSKKACIFRLNNKVPIVLFSDKHRQYVETFLPKFQQNSIAISKINLT